MIKKFRLYESRIKAKRLDYILRIRFPPLGKTR